ncbi:Uncharacterized protein PCOAH_00035880 [Plasmodium coatneyi]|uniref:Uncharacterized protein n=1 Tax=Plasmodium coatneyi TaxID=208452 RepID=A0A1B1E222_9APIC|nr:Uncharacterized protein PCOAH_00035880 [Plasmodium coatneyi]ANQ09056.1 Uncharacterized protein PCOAH_00035880 [Plasmodium coatneyi]
MAGTHDLITQYKIGAPQTSGGGGMQNIPRMFIIEVNCLSENHSNILYKCLSSDESLKQNEMYKQVNISGSLIKM